MDKRYVFRKQTLTFHAKPVTRVSIYRITRNGMPDICHMHPYLMGATRFERKLKMGIFPAFGNYAVMRYRLFGIQRGDRHFFCGRSCDVLSAR